MIALVLFAGFIGLILIGIPVSISIGAAVFATFLTSESSDATYIIPQQLLEGVRKPSLTAVPLHHGWQFDEYGWHDRPDFQFRQFSC